MSGDGLSAGRWRSRPGLEAAIREAIGKPTGDIYDSDLVGLSLLRFQWRGWRHHGASTEAPPTGWQTAVATGKPRGR